MIGIPLGVRGQERKAINVERGNRNDGRDSIDSSLWGVEKKEKGPDATAVYLLRSAKQEAAWH